MNTNADPSAKTVMEQIVATEAEVAETYRRVSALHTKSNAQGLSEGKKQEIARELEEVQKLLNTHKDQLARLRTQERKSFMYVAALILIIFACYAFYILVFGPVI